MATIWEESRALFDDIIAGLQAGDRDAERTARKFLKHRRKHAERQELLIYVLAFACTIRSEEEGTNHEIRERHERS
jgi:hypothetical protein